MKILTFYEPLPGVCPARQLLLIARWAEAWRLAGFTPLCLSEGHPRMVEALRSHGGALAAQGTAFQRALQMQWLTASVLKDGEGAIISHYDVLPGSEPWGLPDFTATMHVARDLEYGVGLKDRLIQFVTVPAIHMEFREAVELDSETPLYVHHNTPEQRALLVPPMTWYVDKPEPVQSTGQFGPQFAPKVRRG